MASLKEIKGRISSVGSTQKITSAMKMVASAKLRKAQNQIENFLPYENHLQSILTNFLSSETNFSSPLSTVREVNAVAVVVLSSNSGLCGVFNSNVIHLCNEVLSEYSHLSQDRIHIYPIGRKVEDALKKEGLEVRGSYIKLMDKPDFEGAKKIADQLITDFLAKKIDRVELVYNHFKNTAVQVPRREPFLPLSFDREISKEHSSFTTDYIVEPDRKSVLDVLIPKTLRSKIYAVLLDSAAAEHGARTMAMQIATDNAKELLEELNIQYNKQRQQAITNELLDIIGGQVH
jgi:ATP synthase, F1 gamma subunit